MTTTWVGIGDLILARPGQRLGAVLGSCVAVILWHPPTRTAAMSHVLLPGRLLAHTDDGPGRYADESWRLMRRRLLGEGIAPRDCVCHVVGGGRGLQGGEIGRHNVRRVLDLLDADGIWVERFEAGGNRYRVVTFDPADGDLRVLCHRVPPRPEAIAPGLRRRA